jgi:lauroyl/myristoyl acyltransferase
MDPTPYFIMGMLTGIAGTLAIQFFANRKVKRALAEIARTAPEQEQEERQQQRRETLEMHRRLATLEKIITDQPRRLEHEIDSLR